MHGLPLYASRGLQTKHPTETMGKRKHRGAKGAPGAASEVTRVDGVGATAAAAAAAAAQPGGGARRVTESSCFLFDQELYIPPAAKRRRSDPSTSAVMWRGRPVLIQKAEPNPFPRSGPGVVEERSVRIPRRRG